MLPAGTHIDIASTALWPLKVLVTSSISTAFMVLGVNILRGVSERLGTPCRVDRSLLVMRRLRPPRLTVAVVLAFRRIESYGTTNALRWCNYASIRTLFHTLL